VYFGQITRFAEARLRQTGRRMGFRAALAAAAALAFVVFLFFGLAALAVWMAHYMRLQDALFLIAGGALVVVVGIVIALQLEAGKHRRLAAQRESFDRQLVRAAALSAMPSRLPSRSVTGLGLVAAGALLVLLGRRRND
jgi:cytochrome c biogenesis protein CcdA